MDHAAVDIEFVHARGISVATAWAGSRESGAPVLVWLHGLGGSSTVAFAGAANHRKLRGWTSLLVDLPGHGSSEAPAEWPYEIEALADLVMEAISSLVDGPAIVFGHSMGGSVAIACAHTHPGAVERLIVAEPNLDPGKGTICVRIAGQDEDRFVRQGYPALLRTTRILAEKGDTESRDWLRTLELADPVALHRCSRSLLAERSPTFRQQLAGLSVPVAVISGEHSSFETMPNDHILKGYVVPNAGHQMIVGNPDGFIAMMAHILGQP
jgi:pimeloyl-ACP methyl ester carboxylesterase